jgi:ABC-type transport system substrate-binding protein
MEKKNIAITVLIIALVASGVGNIVLVVIGNPPSGPPSAGTTFVMATSSGPSYLEPVNSWDSASNDVLEQVVETLFFWDLSDVDLPMINVLAYSYFFVDTTTIQIRLREGIKFHDGTEFNAAAAKWNFDRLLFLTNCTGTNTVAVAQTQSLWMNPDGVTPIISGVTAVGDYNITITLSNPYAPVISTLTYINAGMISPTAHAAYAERLIPLTTDKLVGTGPYKFVSYTPSVEVRFTRWDEYWQGVGNFQTVIYAIYSDSTTAHNAYLGGTIDWNQMYADQNLATYEADDDFVVYRFTEETGKPSLVYQYIGLNNQKLNVTWRRALAYAINYTYCHEVLRQGNAIRAVSPISPGFGATYNSSIVPGVTPWIPPNDGDIATARSIMQSMGFGTTFTTDDEWKAIANGTAGTPFKTVRNTYNTGNQYREDLFVALTNWFSLIGVAVEDDGVTFSEFLNYLNNIGTGPDQGWDHLEVYAIGWGPDYLDPYNMIDPLFNNASTSNSAQVNDPMLQSMMASALAETDATARANIYKDLQYYLASNFFHIPIYHSKVTHTWRADIYGEGMANAMGSTSIFPIYRGLFPPF